MVSWAADSPSSTSQDVVSSACLSHAAAGGGIALRIEVHQQHALLGAGQRRRQVHGRRRLADAALLVGDRDDAAHGRVSAPAPRCDARHPARGRSRARASPRATAPARRASRPRADGPSSPRAGRPARATGRMRQRSRRACRRRGRRRCRTASRARQSSSRAWARVTLARRSSATSLVQEADLLADGVEQRELPRRLQQRQRNPRQAGAGAGIENRDARRGTAAR